MDWNTLCICRKQDFFLFVSYNVLVTTLPTSLRLVNQHNVLIMIRCSVFIQVVTEVKASGCWKQEEASGYISHVQCNMDFTLKDEYDSTAEEALCCYIYQLHETTSLFFHCTKLSHCVCLSDRQKVCADSVQFVRPYYESDLTGGIDQIPVTHTQTNRDACFAATLRALYLSDNDFEVLPADIGKLTKLQIVS